MINSIVLFQEFEFEKENVPFPNPAVPKVPAREVTFRRMNIEIIHEKPIKAYF